MKNIPFKKLFAHTAVGVATTALSFYAPAQSYGASTEPQDLSKLYRIATECASNGELIYTFVLTKPSADVTELDNKDIPKRQLVESNEQALKSRIRMIRNVDMQNFYPNDAEVEKVWNKAGKYMVSPCP